MSVACGRRFGRFLPLLVVVAAGCEMNLPGKPDPNNQPVLPDHEMNFRPLFARNCAGCHGKDGKAGPAPPLNDDLFRAGVSEEDLRMVIARGRSVTKEQKTMMPAFLKSKGGTLSQRQIDVLVQEIKGPSNPWAPEERPLQPPPQDVPYTYTPPKDLSAAVERGHKLFAQHCAGCHGKDGRGGKEKNAVNDPAFLALVSDQALRRIMITGRPDLAVKGKYMPGYSPERGRKQPLTSTEINDLVVLLASWRGSGQAGSK